MVLGPVDARLDDALGEFGASERLCDLGSDLKVSCGDAGPDRPEQRARIGSEVHECRHGGGRDACDHAAPARVHRGHGARARAREQDGHAVGHTHQHRVSAAHARDRIGSHARGKRVARRHHRAAVHLAHIRHDGVVGDPRRSREARVVLADRGVAVARLTRRDAGIRLHALQVERVEGRRAHAAEARGERMRETSSRQQRAAEDRGMGRDVAGSGGFSQHRRLYRLDAALA